MGVLFGVNGFKDKRIVYFSTELNLPAVGDFSDCYYIQNGTQPYLKYWNGASFANAADREDGIKAVSDYFRDYYATFADIDTSKYLERCREIVVISDENNGGVPTKYFFDGTELSSNLSKSILERIEALEYIPVTINSFTNNVGVVEKGSVVSSITFNYSINKQAVLVIDNGIGGVSGNSFTKNGLSITSNITFTLSANDDKNTATKSTSIRFDNRMFYGSSSKTSLSNDDILGLSDSALVNSRQRVITLSGNGQYPVIAFEASLGTPTFVMAGLVNTDWSINQQSITNASGYTTLYNVCRMNTIQNSSSISITIQ